jgi:5,6-dimethylbenzimidazole synthase
MEVSKPLDIFEAIYSRRTIRHFKKDEKVPDDVVERIIDAGRQAPSPENIQPWKWIVVRDPESKKLLADLAQETSALAFGMAKYDMPADRLWYVPPEARVDTVEGMFDGSLFRYPENSDVVLLSCTSDQYYDIPYVPSSIREITDSAFAMAMENMWLAATALGIGAGWDSFPCIGDDRRRDMVMKHFGIPFGWRPVTAFCLGIPERSRALGPTRYPFEGVAFSEYWGKPYVRAALRKK